MAAAALAPVVAQADQPQPERVEAILFELPGYEKGSVLISPTTIDTAIGKATPIAFYVKKTAYVLERQNGSLEIKTQRQITGAMLKGLISD